MGILRSGGQTSQGGSSRRARSERVGQPTPGGSPCTGARGRHPVVAAGQQVAVLRGEIDLVTIDEVAGLLDHAVRAHTPSGDLYVDLADVTFIGVAGARLLVGAAGRMTSGHRLVILHPPPLLDRLVEIGWGSVPALHLARAEAEAGRPAASPPPRTGPTPWGSRRPAAVGP